MFQWVCPAGLNYEHYDVATEQHPISTDNLDQKYVRIRVGDSLKVRHQEIQEWKKLLP